MRTSPLRWTKTVVGVVARDGAYRIGFFADGTEDSCQRGISKYLGHRIRDGYLQALKYEKAEFGYE